MDVHGKQQSWKASLGGISWDFERRNDVRRRWWYVRISLWLQTAPSHWYLRRHRASPGDVNCERRAITGSELHAVPCRSASCVYTIVQSKLVVLKSLSTFLSHAIASAWHPRDLAEASGSTLATPTWYLSSSFSSMSAFEDFDALLRPISARGGPQSAWVWSEETSENAEDFAGHCPLAMAPCSAEWSMHDLGVDAVISAVQEEGQSMIGSGAEVACVAVCFFFMSRRQVCTLTLT